MIQSVQHGRAFFLQGMRGSEAQLKYAKALGDEIDVETEGDSLTLFTSVFRLIPRLLQFLTPMSTSALTTSMYNVISLNILKSSQGEEKCTPEMMILHSQLLRSDYEVESVRIPKELMVKSEKYFLMNDLQLWNGVPNLSCFFSRLCPAYCERTQYRTVSRR